MGGITYYINIWNEWDRGNQTDREFSRGKECGLWGSNGHFELVIFLSFSQHIHTHTYIFYINIPTPFFPYRSAPFPVAVGNTAGMGRASYACPLKPDRNN